MPVAQSASRHRAEAALWRAAQAEGLDALQDLSEFVAATAVAQRLGLR